MARTCDSIAKHAVALNPTKFTNPVKDNKPSQSKITTLLTVYCAYKINHQVTPAQMTPHGSWLHQVRTLCLVPQPSFFGPRDDNDGDPILCSVVQALPSSNVTAAGAEGAWLALYVRLLF
jgi:hypothetical protein